MHGERVWKSTTTTYHSTFTDKSGSRLVGSISCPQKIPPELMLSKMTKTKSKPEPIITVLEDISKESWPQSQ